MSTEPWAVPTASTFDALVHTSTLCSTSTRSRSTGRRSTIRRARSRRTARPRGAAVEELVAHGLDAPHCGAAPSDAPRRAGTGPPRSCRISTTGLTCTDAHLGQSRWSDGAGESPSPGGGPGSGHRADLLKRRSRLFPDCFRRARGPADSPGPYLPTSALSPRRRQRGVPRWGGHRWGAGVAHPDGD